MTTPIASIDHTQIPWGKRQPDAEAHRARRGVIGRTPYTETERREPVASIAASLKAVRAYIRRYVVVTDDQAVAVALWTAHTHAIAAADCTPYLHVTSATARAGKTRLLEALEPVVARPWLTGRTSAAALVRRIDRDQPTLLLDESDAALGADADREYREALRGLLNVGYRRSGRVTVCVGQGAAIQARDFAAYAAKAIAGIGELPGTIADRSVRIVLRRRTQDEACARWRERDGHAEAAPLHQVLVAWAGQEPIIAALREARPDLPPALGDRAADVWEPLFAIADLAGGDWPTVARRAAAALAGEGAAAETDITVELLRDIAAILDDDTRAVIPSADLLAALVAQTDRPWADWKQGRALSARRLARLLAPLDIHPADHHIPGARRGYRREPLMDAVARYLPSHVRMCADSNKTGVDPSDPMCAADPTVRTSKTLESPIEPGSGAHAHIDPGNGRAGEDLPLLAASRGGEEEDWFHGGEY